MRGDPCTSREGEPKVRWATDLAAWFVCEQDSARGKIRYAYWCRRCRGWHTSTARTRKSMWDSAKGIAWLRRELGLPERPAPPS